MYRTTKKGFIFYSITTVLTFFIIYQSNLSFLGLPPEMHSSRVASILLVLYALVRCESNWPIELQQKSKIGRTFIRIVRLYLIFALYSCTLYLIQGPGVGTHSFITLINFFIITIPIIWAYNILFDDIDSFMKVLLYVGLIQGVVIVIGQKFPSFILFLNTTFNYKADLNSNYIFIDLVNNYAGGIGCITSQGAIRFASGLIASSFLYIKHSQSKYFFIFVFFAVVSSMIARTGLVLDLVCLISIIISKLHERKIISIIAFLGLLCVISLISANIISANSSYWKDRYKRYESLKEDKGVVFFTDYFQGEETTYPCLEENLFVGVGIFSGQSASGTKVNVDGGFLRTYSAYGLIPALIFYYILFTNFYILLKIPKIWYDKVLLMMLIISLIIGEFKEFFFMTYWPMTFFIVTSTLICKTQRLYIE